MLRIVSFILPVEHLGDGQKELNRPDLRVVWDEPKLKLMFVLCLQRISSMNGVSFA
jgi:hypothetical protein